MLYLIFCNFFEIIPKIFLFLALFIDILVVFFYIFFNFGFVFRMSPRNILCMLIIFFLCFFILLWIILAVINFLWTEIFFNFLVKIKFFKIFKNILRIIKNSISLIHYKLVKLLEVWLFFLFCFRYYYVFISSLNFVFKDFWHHFILFLNI